MIPLKEIAESLSVAAVMLLVLLPVRVLFVRYVSDNWFGSFGLITVISVTILILSYRDKLGWFGRAFTRQMFKVNSGKRKYFTWVNLCLGLIFFTSVVYGVELSNSQFTDQKAELMEQVDIKNMEELQEKLQDEELDWRDLPLAFLAFFYIMFFRFDIYATMIGSLNDISDGYYLHFSTVFMVEILEVMGILIFSKFFLKKKEISFK